MKSKAIFFDIDGTLLTEDSHIIPTSTITSLKKAQENGHLLFINTGRPFISIDNFIKELNFDGYICGCGTYIIYKNEVLLNKTLELDLCTEIVKQLRNFKIDAVLEGYDELYYDLDENIKSSTLKSLKKRHLETELYRGKTFDDEKLHFDKLTIFGDEESNFEAFQEIFKNNFEFITRGKYFYELVPLSYSKASGIKFIENALNIPHEHTYAIGDSTNDLSMLEYVQTSIAMGNSCQELFKKVSYVTKDIHDAGIEYALKKYNII